jgi:hypothetical protein
MLHGERGERGLMEEGDRGTWDLLPRVGVLLLIAG